MQNTMSHAELTASVQHNFCLTIACLSFVCATLMQSVYAAETSEQRNLQLQADLTAINARLQSNPSSPSLFVDRGMIHFQLAKISESIADFDRAIEIRPNIAPQLWQRGISLYYAQEYAAGQKQFELHRTVNPDDVENSIWHFLCVAAQGDVKQAQEQLIDSRGDSRWPMMKVLQLFRGKLTPQNVIDSVTQDLNVSHTSATAKFYAHLYIGLYYRSRGQNDLANEYLKKASDRTSGGYMADVAIVDLQLQQENLRQ